MPTRRSVRKWLVAALSISILTTCAHVEPPVSARGEAALSAEQFRTVELEFANAAPVRVRFESPQAVRMEVMSFARHSSQIVRFTPSEPGRWTYDARADGVADPIATGALDVTASNEPGFVGAQGHHFVFSNGTPFIALGENRINIYDPSWNHAHLRADQYVRYMAANGMTTLRVFIISDVEDEAHGGRVNPGVLEPTLGHFDESVASEFDGIFRAAEESGVYVVLVAFAIGFSETDPWKSWQDNPYSAERGGPATTRYEFFEPGPARELAAKRIRYLAERYASSTHLLAIDLLNEPEWDGAIPEVSWTDWALEMARAWRSADPYGHLVTVGSVGLNWNIEGDERPWYANPESDIVQWHLYGKETYEVHALAAEMTRRVRDAWSYGKPVLVGEFAYGGEPKPLYDHTHVGLWSGTFAGAGVIAHSAPPFNPDSDEPMTPERARHFGVLRRFLAELPALEPVEAQASSNVSAWALAGPDAAALWLLAPQQVYGQVVEGITATVALTPGTWRITWVDDLTGEPVGAGQVIESLGGSLRVQVPAFRRHLAAKLLRAK